MSFDMAQRAKASDATAAKTLCVREAPSLWMTPTPVTSPRSNNTAWRSVPQVQTRLLPQRACALQAHLP